MTSTCWPVALILRLLGRVRRRAPSSLLDAVRRDQTVMRYAQALGDRAALVGFDWDSPEDALAKVVEETAELAELLEAGADADALADELGDLLFAAIMVARKADVDAEEALARTNRKFRRRFATIERVLAERGVRPEHASLDEMEEIWQLAKRRERSGSNA